MKKNLCISIIVPLFLMLFFSQAFAASSARQDIKPKNTPKPGETESMGKPETSDAQQQQVDEKGNKPEKHPGKKYNFKGVVVSFDGSQLVLNTKDGTPVTFTVDENTDIKFSGPKDGTEKLQENQGAIVQAVKTEKDAYLAVRIHVMPDKPQRIHRVGEVTAYDDRNSITVQDKKGSTTFKIATDVKILPAERAGMLKTGARVTIISPRDPSGGMPVAKGIVIHPETSKGGD